VLFVGQHPGKDEDRRGRLFVGASSKKLRELVPKMWDGPVAYENVTRCWPAGGQQTRDEIAACRPYLRQTLVDVSPTRIVAMGGDAVDGLLGHSVPMMSTRRGYSWAALPVSGRLVPVYYCIHPAAASRNRFVGRWFEEDLAWALGSPDPPPPPLDAELHVVQTVDDASGAVEEIRAESPWFAYDVEWAGVPFGEYFEIACVAVVPSGTDDAYVWPRSVLGDPDVRAPLVELLEDPSVGKVGHNLKGDNLAVWAAWGCRVAGTHGDTRLWRRLVVADVNARLDVCSHLVGMGGHKDENAAALAVAEREIRTARAAERVGQGSLFDGGVRDPALEAAVALMPDDDPMRFAYALVPSAVRDRYCARDAVATARLGDLLEGEIAADPPIKRVWDLIVSRATDAVAQIERWGVAADRSAMETFHEYCDMELESVRARLAVYGDFDPSSPQSVSDLLFKRLGLTPTKTTATGRSSTDREALNAMIDEHPVVGDLVEYRRIEKLRGNYGRSMASWIRSDGRIHPELKIDGTRTGRLSVINPPLQTLPRTYSEEGRAVKRSFVAPPGYLLGQLDYSQIELRGAAFLSRDPVMIEMFLSGEDFHTATAKLIAPIYWGISPDEVDKSHRTAAKSFNFGLLYGMTDKGLARRLDCSLDDAVRLRQAILGKWVKLASWMRSRLKETRRTGFAWTWWAGERARRRPLIGIASRDSLKRSTAENSAVNTPVQGTASDFMLASICDIVDWILGDGVPAKLVLTVHDSVIFEIREDAMEETLLGARDIMQSHDSCGVPLKVDIEVGPTLGDLEPWELAA